MVIARNQPQDRKGARPHCAVAAARSRRRGGRIETLFVALRESAVGTWRRSPGRAKFRRDRGTADIERYGHRRSRGALHRALFSPLSLPPRLIEISQIGRWLIPAGW